MWACGDSHTCMVVYRNSWLISPEPGSLLGRNSIALGREKIQPSPRRRWLVSQLAFVSVLLGPPSGSLDLPDIEFRVPGSDELGLCTRLHLRRTVQVYHRERAVKVGHVQL